MKAEPRRLRAIRATVVRMTIRRHQFRPIHLPTLLIFVLAASVTIIVVGWWMWHAAQVAEAGPVTPDLAVRQAQLRVDVIRNILGVSAAAGGLVALALALRRQYVRERVEYDDNALKLRTAEATEFDASQRRLTDLYAKAAELIGNDNAAVRMAGIYALERIGQEWPTERQMIVDLVGAYLRMPYDRAEPAVEDHPARLGRMAEREVRMTAQRMLRRHLRRDAPTQSANGPLFWDAVRVDLAGATVIDFDLSDCHLLELNCERTLFHGHTQFSRLRVTGPADFTHARFSATSHFHGAVFLGYVSFKEAAFGEKPHLEETVFHWEKNLVFPGLPPGWRKARRGTAEPSGYFVKG